MKRMLAAGGREASKDEANEAQAADDFEKFAHQSFILSIWRRS